MNANVTRGEVTPMKYITVMIIILVLLPFIGKGSPSPWQRTSCTITVTVRTDGTFIGGAYEYICSVFTEIVFGKIFWDYRGLPFNLGGRINLLYCFFWGIATVVDKISNQMILKRLTMYFIIPTGDFFPILSVIIWL
ncbi:putative ABC transporter permease [Ligilactobacillus ruminis]|uniref:putative ABC transporter permease n=1 Tax=Ligilactobacillus ruminis TaxID=1623 RepID=UPI002B4BA165|nr:putative ABC transporter permease [Ligilactobacillus ruminis]